MQVAGRFIGVEIIPVSLGLNGTYGNPDALETLSSTNKVPYRDFPGDTDTDLFFEIIKPRGIYSTTVYVSLDGWVTNATAPINTEQIIWWVRGCAVGEQGLLSTAMGAWTIIGKTFGTGWAQYHRWTTSDSWKAVSISGLTTTYNDYQTILLQVYRSSLDSYAQKIGLSHVKVMLSRRDFQQ